MQRKKVMMSTQLEIVNMQVFQSTVSGINRYDFRSTNFKLDEYQTTAI